MKEENEVDGPLKAQKGIRWPAGDISYEACISRRTRRT